MKLKTIIALMVVMLAFGCVESTIPFFEVEQEMSGFNLSGNLTYSNYTIEECAIDSDDNCIYPNANINIDNISEDVIVAFNLIDANVTITNSTNILVDSNKITPNLTITNSNNIKVHRCEISKEIIIKDMTDFMIYCRGSLLYYYNKTPILGTVINETYIFSPLVEEPEPRNMSEIGYLKLKRAPDDNVRSITWDYHYGGKDWKYITIYGATCHQIPCNFSGAYCLECEELTEQ